jgi:hypothetical protein
MFRHYITVALRNIRKYALQNTVSVLGLAAGLVCLSFSALWIHFEESFDTFHKDADRIYTLLEESPYSPVPCIPQFTPEMLNPLLEFKEVESYTKWNYRHHGKVTELIADSTFFEYFEFSLASGNRSFMRDTNYVAISQSYARKRFPGMDPIGQELFGKTVCAVISPFRGPSHLSFDILTMHLFPMISSGVIGGEMNGLPIIYDELERCPNVFFKIHGGMDTDMLSDSISNVLNRKNRWVDDIIFELLPISDVHKHDFSVVMYIGYEHAGLFAWASLLLTLCALVNFLLFNLNRVRNREHEMVLRIVHGATTRSVLGMMTVESGIILGMASILGFIMVLFLKEPFRRMADIGMTGGYVMWGSLAMIALAFAVSMVVSIISVGMVRRRTMQSTLVRKTGKTFRNISIGIQIFVSVLFAFVVFSFLHQFRFLRNNNWGIRVNDTAALTIFNPDHDFFSGFGGYSYMDDEDFMPPRGESGTEYMDRIDGLYGLTSKLKGIPCVNDVYTGIGDIDNIYRTVHEVFKQDGIWINGNDNIRTNYLDIIDTTLMKYLSLNVLDGAIPNRPLRDDEIVITRNLQRELGLGDIADEPVITIRRHYRKPYNWVWVDGQAKLLGGEEMDVSYTYQVIAVISDLYLVEFNMDPESYILCAPGNTKIIGHSLGWADALVTLTYKPGSRKELAGRVTEIMNGTGLEYELKFTEDSFYETLTNDRHLTALIEALGILCLIISLAGIYSIVALSCQEKKREIAVRKVYGARIRDILSIFARDYGILFIVSSAFGFMVGYPVVREWMKQFRLQATVSWWIFASIFAVMALVICLTVGHRVLSTARENPADVIKSE